MTVSAAPRRLWLVLLVLAGLIGMHGLASDHTAMAAPGTVASPSVGTSGATHGAMTHHSAGLLPDGTQTIEHMPGVDRSTARAARGLADLVATPAPQGGHGVMAMTGLCLAVLAGVGLLVALGRRTPSGRGPRPPTLAAQLLAALRALPPPRPPDVVAGLCVSRT